MEGAEGVDGIGGLSELGVGRMAHLNCGSTPLWGRKVEALPSSCAEEPYIQFHVRNDKNIGNGSAC